MNQSDLTVKVNDNLTMLRNTDGIPFPIGKSFTVRKSTYISRLIKSGDLTIFEDRKKKE